MVGLGTLTPMQRYEAEASIDSHSRTSSFLHHPGGEVAGVGVGFGVDELDVPSGWRRRTTGSMNHDHDHDHDHDHHHSDHDHEEENVLGFLPPHKEDDDMMGHDLGMTRCDPIIG